MREADITAKLSLLQDRLERSRGRPDLSASLEDLYWLELDRLRTLKCYEVLPGYASWLAAYRRTD